MLASPDGGRHIRRTAKAALGADPLAEAATLGNELGAILLTEGGWSILREATKP